MAKFHTGSVEFIWAGTNFASYVDNITPAPGRQVFPLDVTAFADAAEAFIAGIEQSRQVTVSGPYDDAAGGPDRTFGTGVGTLATFTFYPAGTASGARIYTGTMLLVSYEPTGPVKERVSYNAVFQVSGAVTAGTV